VARAAAHRQKEEQLDVEKLVAVVAAKALGDGGIPFPGCVKSGRRPYRVERAAGLSQDPDGALDVDVGDFTRLDVWLGGDVETSAWAGSS